MTTTKTKTKTKTSAGSTAIQRAVGIAGLTRNGLFEQLDNVGRRTVYEAVDADHVGSARAREVAELAHDIAIFHVTQAAREAGAPAEDRRALRAIASRIIRIDDPAVMLDSVFGIEAPGDPASRSSVMVERTLPGGRAVVHHDRSDGLLRLRYHSHAIAGEWIEFVCAAGRCVPIR